MIVLLLAAIVTVSIILVAFTQMRERARIERARRITALETGSCKIATLYGILQAYEYRCANEKFLRNGI